MNQLQLKSKRLDGLAMRNAKTQSAFEPPFVAGWVELLQPLQIT
jgi:hypothetical protein